MVLLHVENAKSPYRGLFAFLPSDDGDSRHRILDTDFLFSKVGRYDSKDLTFNE